ncbi:hypothetical protein, partial [Bacillus altitudinis]|uniref:hypothetical protein n=1 Tax=Bacillus altitudinis TaxID=293387 RepID=UPI003F7B896F
GHVLRPGTLLQLRPSFPATCCALVFCFSPAIFSGHVLRPGILLQPGHLFTPRAALVLASAAFIFSGHVLRPGTLLQLRPSFPATCCALVFASARPSFYPTCCPGICFSPAIFLPHVLPWYLLQPGHFFRPRAVPK